MEIGIYPEKIDGSFIPFRLASVANVEVDGEGVLLDKITGSLHLLNPVANVVWSCMDGSGTVDELAVDISAAFAADLEQVRCDVLAFARELGRRGLLKGVVSSEPPKPDLDDEESVANEQRP